MVYSIPKSSQATFNEVVIADFGPFQVAIPSKTTLTNRQIFSAQMRVPQRQYQSQGWFIYNGQPIAALDDLVIGSASTEDSPFSPIQRIAPAIPVSFEVKSARPLPGKLYAQATLTCEIPDADFPFFSIFRQVRPRFVKVYPFRKIANLSTQVTQLLTDEARFVETNRHQLKQVPFYKAQFEL